MIERYFDLLKNIFYAFSGSRSFTFVDFLLTLLGTVALVAVILGFLAIISGGAFLPQKMWKKYITPLNIKKCEILSQTPDTEIQLSEEYSALRGKIIRREIGFLVAMAFYIPIVAVVLMYLGYLLFHI